MGIIVGLIAIAIGSMMVIRSQSFLSVFGQIPWAEANLSGGSLSFYKLLGCVIVFLGILGATGLFGKLLLAVLTPLFGTALRGQ